VGTYGGGLNRLDVSRGIFTRYRHDPGNPNSLPSDFVWAIYEDRAGVFWIGTTGGLSRMNREIEEDNESDRTFINYQHHPTDPNSLSESYVTSIIEDRTGTLWIGTNNGGLCRFNKDSEKFVNYRHKPEDLSSLSSDAIRAILADDDFLWVGTYGGGLNRLRLSEIDTLERAKPRFKRYQHDPDDPSSLSHNVIREIYCDRAGILWVATWGGGLNKFSQRKFEVYRHEPNNANSLIRNDVTAICEVSNSNALLVGTQDGGLTEIVWGGSDKAYFKHFQSNPENPRSLSDNYITAILESREEADIFWIGTYGRGLNRFDRKAGAFLRFGHDASDPNSLPDNRIGSLHASLRHPGVFWIGSDGGGLVQMRLDNSQNPKFTRVAIGESQPDGPTLNVIRSIYESPYQPGVLWIALDQHGVLNLTLDGNDNVIHYWHLPVSGLTGSRVYTVLATRDSSVWIGTNGGLNKLVRSRIAAENKRFANPSPGVDLEVEVSVAYRKSDGLPSEAVHGILEDSRGNLWISTDNGLSKFDRETESFRNYSAGDGLQSNQFRWGAFHNGRSGKMYFGGINGFNVFHPDSIKDNPYVSPVVFTDFRIANKSVKIDPSGTEKGFTMPKHITESDEVVLSYKENVLSFEFSALDYASPDRNLFSYRMDNFDQDWSSPSHDHRATYTNLDPGAYIFRVKGSNHDGIWNEQGTSIKVTILPPWWRTWWAYGFYTFFVGFALYLLRRYEMNRQQHKHDAKLQQMEARKLQEVDALKSRFFANISHEFRTPLTLILGHTEGALHETEKESAKRKLKVVLRNTGKLRTLINQLLDLSKFEAGRMELRASRQDIVPVLRSAMAAFESHAALKEIALSFSAEPAVIPVFFEREQIEKVMYNLLSNALKFTKKNGQVAVEVGIEKNISGDGRAPASADFESGELKLMVRDTGIGIPAESLPNIFDRFYQVNATETRENEGTGIGLALTQELIQLPGGMISVESEVGIGTTFTIKLPLGSSHLRPEQIVARDENERGDKVDFGAASSEESAAVQSVQPQASPLKTRNSKSVLIVEDNDDMRALIRDSLPGSYRITEATNGESGFAAALDTVPDLIITDVMMPGVDGYELTHQLRRHDATSHIPIIMLTAKATDEDLFEGLEKGVDVYLTKPFNKHELLIRVRKLIELRQQLLARVKTRPMITASEVMVTSMDQQFLERLQKIVEENMEEETFQVEDIGRQIGLSRSQLQRKLSALLDCSPAAYLRRVRLERAKQLLEKNAGTVSEICFQVGYGNVSAFARAFRETFGKSPSAVRARNPN
jgi:signal transduction histidine kinase/DNA-binding response OmpR family regulator/ligand-binding sensor domain-containing protein